MNHHHQQQLTPAPVVHEPRIIHPDGSEVVIGTVLDDEFNLTTGEVRVARIINGRRWDTRSASLVAGYGTGTDSVSIQRLYRVSRHEYFHLEFSWCRDWPFVSGPMLKVVEYLDVFDYLKTLVRSEDLFVFLRDWYMTEWLVYDFGEAARWAEKALTADDYERLFNPAVVADPPADAGREEEDE